MLPPESRAEPAIGAAMFSPARSASPCSFVATSRRSAAAGPWSHRRPQGGVLGDASDPGRRTRRIGIGGDGHHPAARKASDRPRAPARHGRTTSPRRRRRRRDEVRQFACPFPATPATPSISPAYTVRSRPRKPEPSPTPVELHVAQLERRPSRPTGSSAVLRTGSTLSPTIAVTSSSLEMLAVGRVLEHHPARAQHGHPVGDVADLAHLVGDDHDAGALGAELADDGEEPVDLRRREHARRLIEDQHVRTRPAGP